MHASKLEGGSVTARLYRFLSAHEGKWFGGWELSTKIKTTAISTRISEVRRQLPPYERIEVKHTREGWFYRLVHDYRGLGREDWETAMQHHHDIKYDWLIEEMGGLKAVKELIPVPIEQVKRALDSGDLHLNTIPLSLWSRAAEVYSIGSVLKARIGGRKWPRELSAAERVSLLKRAATRLAQGEE